MSKLIQYRGAVYREASRVPSFEEAWEVWLEGDPFPGGRVPLKDEIGTLRNIYLRQKPDSELEPIARENLIYRYQPKVRQAYDRAVASLDKMDGALCYRAMELKPNQDPVTLDPVGLFWSLDREGAGTYWGSYDRSMRWVLYRAKVNGAGIDAEAIVLNRIRYPEEREVTFLPGTQLWVDWVEVGGRYNQRYDINAYRKA